MQTATILSQEEAANLLGITPIEITRGAVRGKLKAYQIGNGPPRYVADDLQRWLTTSQDDAIPKNDTAWFCGERDLNFLENQARDVVAAQVPDDFVPAAEVEKQYNADRVPTFTRRVQFNDPNGLLKRLPSKTVTLNGSEYDKKYGTILMAALVNKARSEAWRVLSVVNGLPASDMHLSMLARLYQPDNYLKVYTAIGEMTKRIFATKQAVVIVKDKLTGNDIRVPGTIDVLLAKNILPSIDSIVRAAF